LLAEPQAAPSLSKQFPVPLDFCLSLSAIIEMASDVVLHIQQAIALPAAVLLWNEADSGDMTILIQKYNHVHPCRKMGKDRTNFSAAEVEGVHRIPEERHLQTPALSLPIHASLSGFPNLVDDGFAKHKSISH
jgi:hypothetical protein